MAYYYVKNGGTAVGDAGRYASQQTGSFATLGAANYYNDIQTAFAATTVPVSSDFINISDLNVYVLAANIDLRYTIDVVPFIVAVSDISIDTARTAGNRADIDNIVSGNKLIQIANGYYSGVAFHTPTFMSFSSTVTLEDCLIEATGPNSYPIYINNDRVIVRITNSEIVFGHSNSSMRLQSGGWLIAKNLILSSPGVVNNFISAAFVSGGATAEVTSTDLSLITGTLLANVGGATADDAINVRFDLCKIAAGVAFTNETFKFEGQRALFTRCSDSSVAAEYQYHLHAFGGDVDDDSAIYRNEDEAFTESNQKISYKIVTNSDASLGAPLWLDFPVLRYSKLATLATDTLRFYLTSATALTDKDIYIEVSYPDGTNKQTPNFISSAPTTVGGTLDLMATGTTLTTDGTSTWTGGLTNKYQIDVSTAGDAGADCQPIVKVYVTIPSVTIQVASEFGLN